MNSYLIPGGQTSSEGCLLLKEKKCSKRNKFLSLKAIASFGF